MGDRDECYIALYAAKNGAFYGPKTLLTGLVGALLLFCNESNAREEAKGLAQDRREKCRVALLGKIDQTKGVGLGAEGHGGTRGVVTS